MNKRALIEEIENMRPRFQEAVELMLVHVRYLVRARGLMHPEELNHRVIGRVKSTTSCIKKMRRVEREKRISLESAAEIQRHIDDIAGIRVVCNYLDDLLLVYGYIQNHRAFRELRGKREDYLRHPKVGYRALHTVVRIQTNSGPAKCEVQVRTALQDAWAVKSHALVYKLKKADLARLPLQIRNLLVQQSDMLYNIDQTAGELAGLVKQYLPGSPE